MEIELKNITEAEKAALADEYDKALSFCADESAEYSLSHYGKMKKIIGTRPTPCASIRRKRSRIAAVLVAATMLIALVGCTAAVYKQQIGDFFTVIFDEHIKGSFTEKNTENNGNINDVYALTYVPNGYVLVDEIISDTLVRYIMESQNGDQIILIQAPLNSGHYFMDDDSSSYTVIETDEYTVYSRTINNTYVCIWSNAEYEFALYFDIEISEEEIVKIIGELKPLEK